ncbi:alpha/beta hydrolase [Rhizobacter sp. J219]|uniref:alpha/beta hydrolase n=1 Tax=Rhizobacter sp. J219 TaxID=2898430 RepID=UPI0021507EB0|nr:alpha/beta hydrolase [Rhizobacter sp. J219]MCR5882365.1 alpha/beta hydrolase [Rhizobacter sp. J219]
MLEHTLIPLRHPLPPAELCRVGGAEGLVACVHADGNTGTSRRLQPVLQRLQARGFATLDLELLAPDESDNAQPPLDAQALARRLDQALDLLPASVKDLPLGLFASDHAAAAMLYCAACRPHGLRALVSRSGRVDLASEVLGDVRSPTLLVVAAGDPEIVDLNRRAFSRLRCEKRIDVVPRATHHFLEAGTLDVVAQLALDWFATHLAPPG